MNQPLPLLEQLKILENLQELDLKIETLRKGQSSLPAALRTMEDSLGKLQAALNSKKDSIGEIEKVSRQTQAALDLNQDRLARSNAKFEAIHNSQEFQAVNKEIDQLKKLNQSLDEQSKKSVTDLKIAQEEASGLEDQIQKLRQQHDSEATTVSGQDTQFKSDIATLLSDRTKLASQVEPRILAQYDRVRVARGGWGIVPAVGGRCKGCNMMVPPQLYNEIHRGTSLHSCPSCHRILFVAAASPSSSAGTGRVTKSMSME